MNELDQLLVGKDLVSSSPRNATLMEIERILCDFVAYDIVAGLHYHVSLEGE